MSRDVHRSRLGKVAGEVAEAIFSAIVRAGSALVTAASFSLSDWPGYLDRTADDCGIATARGEGELQLAADMPTVVRAHIFAL